MARSRSPPVHPRSTRASEISAGSFDDLESIGRRLAAPRIDDEVVGQLLTFGETSKARALDSADMDENIAPAPFGLNEAEAFLSIEPFDDASMHVLSFRGNV
jgi:hypothetical protein